MKKGELVFSILLLPVDFLMLVVAGLATYFLRTEIISSVRPVLFELNLPFDRYLILVIGVALIFVAMYALSGLYRLRSTRKTLQEFARVFIASSAGLMAIIVYIFLRQELFDSRFLVLGFWLLAVFFVSLGRLAMRYLQRFMISRYDYGIHRLLVIGNDETSRKIVEEIQSKPDIGYRIVGQLANPEMMDIEAAVARQGVDEVILANPNYPEEGILALIDFCNEHHVVFKFVPNIYQTLTTNFAFDTLTGVPIIELKRTALDGWGQVIKRVIDIVGALFGLIVLSPAFLIIAILIKLNSPGPVLVRLQRVSRGKYFKLYKFRSMIDGAEKYKQYLLHLNERQGGGPLFKMKNDPRVTRIGRILRKYRLDEFPQLLNVLKGEISLVGPRPHEPEEVARYEKHHKRVLAIKGGMTGMAQISGSSDLPFDEEVALDTLYIEHWSLWQDVKILIWTVLKVFRDQSAV